jgi:hypothetical protein
MPKPILATICLCLMPFLCSCSMTHSAVIKPGVIYQGISLTKQIQQDGDIAMASEETTKFYTTDKEAIAIIHFRNFHGDVNLRWEWISPDGDIYYTTENLPVRSSNHKFFKELSAWHLLTIKGDRAAQMPGNWVVRFYVDDNLFDYKTFEISNSI